MKFKLIRTTFPLAVSIFSLSAIKAQEIPESVREIGIGFSSSTSFSLRYQWGTDQLVYRLSAISLGATTSATNTDEVTSSQNSGNFYTYSPSVNTPINLSGGLNFSLAKIKAINERFGLMYGAVIGINLSYVDAKTETDYAFVPSQQNINNYNANYAPYTTEAITSSYAPFIGFLIGARYKLNSSFHLYAEIAPNINYTYAETSSTSTSGISSPPSSDKITNTYGLSGLANSGVLITIVYRITK